MARADRWGGQLADLVAVVWHRFAEVLSNRPDTLLAALAAVIVVAWPVTWRLTRIVVTIVHECGHALAAVVVGRGLTGIRLHPDTSGMTVSTGAPRGPGLVVTVLGGYPAPSVLGLAGMALVADGHSRVLLWSLVVLLVVTLWYVRNPFGVFVVLPRRRGHRVGCTRRPARDRRRGRGWAGVVPAARWRAGGGGAAPEQAGAQ